MLRALREFRVRGVATNVATSRESHRRTRGCCQVYFPWSVYCIGLKACDEIGNKRPPSRSIRCV
jgi:hypothetical protein